MFKLISIGNSSNIILILLIMFGGCVEVKVGDVIKCVIFLCIIII